MKQPQRVTITDCPHENRHKGLTGYIQDRYADGTACIGLGFGQICIARGWQDMEPVKREDLKFNEDGLVVNDGDSPSQEAAPAPKRRGRPRKADAGTAMPKTRRAKRVASDTVGESSTYPAAGTPEPTTSANNQAAQPPISVTAIEDGRVSLAYAVGSARITVEGATVDDLRTILAITKSITKGVK